MSQDLSFQSLWKDHVKKRINFWEFLNVQFDNKRKKTEYSENDQKYALGCCF